MKPEILFETERMFLRKLTLRDLMWFHELGMDPEVMRYIRPVNFDIGHSQKELERLINFTGKYRAKGYWLACERESRQPLGILTLRYMEGSSETELGYRWSRASWGQGYATEAARALVSFGFKEQNIPKMVAVVHPKNLASQRVLEKCGFAYLRKEFHYNFKLNYYELSRKDFFRLSKNWSSK